MNVRLFFFLLAVQACVPTGQMSDNTAYSAKILRYADHAYEPQIKSIALHPRSTNPQATLAPAVTDFGNWNLVLEFDDLQAQQNNYFLHILHCNHDWTKSSLNDLDFLDQYNEFPINDYSYSVDTHVPYVHYSLPLPPVKLPGNYLAVVYRGSDKNDIILSKRFMVYDKRVAIAGEQNLVGAGNIARANQQINFTINYQGLEVIDPLENIRVSIRQNQRWDNLMQNVRPSFVRELQKQLEYRFFDEEMMFKGGNEFRFFDFRSLAHPGRNVRSVNRSVKPYNVFIERDKPRTDEVYAQYLDLNGGFFIDNLDYTDPAFTNYAFVNFSLETPDPVPGEVYVTGAFHYWNLNDENRMRYDTVRRMYTAALLLKQGWYDYQYVVRSKTLPPYYLEGSHFETENFYEIFVYYRMFQPRADLLVGYMQHKMNPR